MNQFKKTTTTNEKRRGIYFQIGLIIAGGLTLVAFEWTSPVSLTDLPGSVETYEAEIDFPIIMPEVKIDRPEIKPIVQPKKSEVIKIVKKIFEPSPEPSPAPTPELKFDPNEWEPIEPIIGPEEEFTIVENMPEFVGGERARLKFLYDNLKYPSVDKAGNVQGTVYLNFLVNKKGEIKKVKILRGVSPTIDREAVRVVKAMPNWKPGKQRGKAVNVNYNFRIKFQLKG